jgi:Zn-dependent peptidase ImmA (M78 family)
VPRATYVPITPSVLGWAIEEAGLSFFEVGERTATDAARVEAWVAGKTQPTKTQFRKLSSALRRPSSFFFLAEPPATAGLPPAFRHPPGALGARDLLPEEARAIRRARRIQRISRWIAEERELPEVTLPLAQGQDPDTAADVARTTLNWSVERQLATASSFALVRELRTQMEGIGLIVLHQSMTEEGCRGFSLFDTHAPLLAINTAYNAAARAFSYMHEFGHLVRRKDSICTLNLDSALERWCERFASSFLLPSEAVNDYLDSRGLSAVTNVDQVSRIANYFRVSLRAVAVRVTQLGRAPDDLYSIVDAQADFRRGGGGGGGETAAERRLREFGDHYSRLLLTAEQTGLLGKQDVQEYLNLSRGQLDEFRLLAAESSG